MGERIRLPVTARLALPMFLALLVFVSYHVVGVRKQGVLGYLKSALVAPGVPKAIMPLVTLNLFVEFVFTKPFSLGVRLFANLLAGHLLLVTFSVLTAALFGATYIGAAVPAAALAALYAFE